ncbi:MAG: hypothetical protein U0175_20205 [Caldilineaceae bacterium]
MPKFTYKKYSKDDQKAMAAWAADCAERVLPFFEAAYPNDDRPRKAIAACREWVRTGVFSMSVIRGASLSAHAAAKIAAENEAACSAAHAAGQAVATAHVSQHAYGGAYYALKAIADNDPANAEARVEAERNWQAEHLPEHLRQEMMDRIIVQKKGNKILVKIDKSEGF